MKANVKTGKTLKDVLGEDGIIRDEIIVADKVICKIRCDTNIGRIKWAYNYTKFYSALMKLAKIRNIDYPDIPKSDIADEAFFEALDKIENAADTICDTIDNLIDSGDVIVGKGVIDCLLTHDKSPTGIDLLTTSLMPVFEFSAQLEGESERNSQDKIAEKYKKTMKEQASKGGDTPNDEPKTN